MLVLDVVAPSRAGVAARQSELVRQVQGELLELQKDAGVAPVNRISVLPAPESTVIFSVSGNRPKALAMTACLGVGVTITIVLAAERRRRHITRTRSLISASEAVPVG